MKIAYQGKDPVVDYDERAAIFKARYGYSLPADYIGFLKENGAGGSPEPGFFDGICQLEIIYNLCFDESIQKWDLAHLVYEEYVGEGWLSKNLLPIACAQGCHVLYCLILSGPLYGQITERMDDDILIPDDCDLATFEGLGHYIVATSINDFICKLEMEPRPYGS